MTSMISEERSFLGGMTYTIEGIKERIEQISTCDLNGLVDLVINLIKSHRLRIDQGVT